MDPIKRNKLRRQIQTAASLTPHQAGKVAGIVENILRDDIPKGKDFFVGDTDSKEIIRQTQAELPRGKPIKGRTPSMCASKCVGPLCDGCPDFEPQYTSVLNIPTAVHQGPSNKENDPPFELEVLPALDDPNYFVLSKKEFELIKGPITGAIVSTINHTINLIVKRKNNPGYNIKEDLDSLLILTQLKHMTEKS